MPDYTPIFIELKNELLIASQQTLGLGKKDADENVKLFFATYESDLLKWMDALNKGNLTHDEFESLVNAQKDLLKVDYLKQKGIQQIKMDQYKEKVIDIVIKIVITAIAKI